MWPCLWPSITMLHRWSSKDQCMDEILGLIPRLWSWWITHHPKNLLDNIQAQESLREGGCCVVFPSLRRLNPGYIATCSYMCVYTLIVLMDTQVCDHLLHNFSPQSTTPVTSAASLVEHVQILPIASDPELLSAVSSFCHSICIVILIRSILSPQSRWRSM